MIVIFMALHAEASPVIKALKLKKCGIKNIGWSVFKDEADSIMLVETGVGPIAAASAVASVFTYLLCGKEADDLKADDLKAEDIYLLNIGSCGVELHKSSPDSKNSVKDIDAADCLKRDSVIKADMETVCLNAGIKRKAYLINKLTDGMSGRFFYPDMVIETEIPEAELISSAVIFDKNGSGIKDGIMDHVSDIETDSLNEDGMGDNSVRLHDMEGAFIYQAAAYFIAPHQQHFIKIVSDDGNAEGVTADYLSSVVEGNLRYIVDYVNQLLDMASDVKTAGCFESEGLAGLLSIDLKASVTMENHIRQLYRYMEAAGMDYREITDRFYAENPLPVKNKKEGIALLRVFEEMSM